MHAYTDRPVTAADVDWIVALHAAAHARPFVVAPTADDVRGALARGTVCERAVLDADGGRAALWRAQLHDGWLVELKTIIAAEPGRGAGRWALRRALEWAFEECGAHRVSLDVTATNAVARSLYERHGMRWEGTFRDGFRASDGTFVHLCHYGMLAHEYRSGANERRWAPRVDDQVSSTASEEG
jgi:RimJ/RimL family protein N-acetyltransferase